MAIGYYYSFDVIIVMALLSQDYTYGELVDFIRAKLGGTLWNLEGMEEENKSAIDAAISETLLEYSSRIAKFGWETIPPGVSHHVMKNPGFGPFKVDFIETSNIFGVGGTGYGLINNLTGIVPANIAGAVGTGLGTDIHTFIQWRKSFQRVTAREPEWQYIEDTKTIVIYNPITYHGCAMVTLPRDFCGIRMLHKGWFAEMASAKSLVQLGENRRKFDGTVQGPGGQDITLGANELISDGEKKVEKLKEELMAFQSIPFPTWD